MHERSLVENLIRQVDQIADANGSSNVTEISVEIGPLCGVEAALVEIAFHDLVGRTGRRHPTNRERKPMQFVTADTALVIVETALTIRCQQCDRISEMPGFVFRCGVCGSGSVKITGGDEFRLLTVSLSEEATNAR